LSEVRFPVVGCAVKGVGNCCVSLF